MADKEPSKKRSLRSKAQKKTETVRERTTKSNVEKPKRIRSTAGKVIRPVGHMRRIGKREYHLPLPDNKVGKVLKKRVRFVPSFLIGAFSEIRQVVWPNFRETIRLTIAVFVFAIIFAIFVGLLDFALDKAFREFILK